jgi:predicted nucleic acid-binding protein
VTTLLLDASVILASFDCDDVHHGAAAQILRDPHVTLTTLDLARFEVANVAVRAWRDPAIVAELLDAIDRISDDGGVIASTRDLLAASARLADEHMISVYDAAYVAASRRGDHALVSCDTRDLISRRLAVTPSDART